MNTEIKSAEEILGYHADVTNCDEQKIIDAMEAYHNQFKEPIKSNDVGDLPQNLDRPYCTKDVLSFLIKGCEYLLNNKSYDGGDYEEISTCVKEGKKLIEQLKQKSIDVCDVEKDEDELWEDVLNIAYLSIEFKTADTIQKLKKQFSITRKIIINHVR